MLSRNEHHEVDCAAELDSFQGCVAKSGPMVYMGNRFLFFRERMLHVLFCKPSEDRHAEQSRDPPKSSVDASSKLHCHTGHSGGICPRKKETICEILHDPQHAGELNAEAQKLQETLLRSESKPCRCKIVDPQNKKRTCILSCASWVCDSNTRLICPSNTHATCSKMDRESSSRHYENLLRHKGSYARVTFAVAKNPGEFFKS